MAKSPISGEQFLHQQNPALHHGQEVENVVSYLREGGGAISQKPKDKIAAYLGFLADETLANDGFLSGNSESINRQVEAEIIKPGDFPEAYFKQQFKLARDRGQRAEDTPSLRQRIIEHVRDDQRVSLSRWAHYMGNDENGVGYPLWYKKYVLDGVKKLSQFSRVEQGDDSKRLVLKKRNKSTVAPFPELNPEAVSAVFSWMQEYKLAGQKHPSDQTTQMLTRSDFGSLYLAAFELVKPQSPEKGDSTEGSWVKYGRVSRDSTREDGTVKRLSESLQGYGTTWCTATEETARMQLMGGDFYIFYSQDTAGEDRIPRVAIRMKHGEIAEIRGVSANQELEPEMADIAIEKAMTLPGGDKYQKRADDMRRLTKIDEKEKNDEELSANELRFLYEVDDVIIGFGQRRDPRIREITRDRLIIEDYFTALGTTDICNILDVVLAAPDQEWRLERLVSSYVMLGHPQDEIAQALIDADGWKFKQFSSEFYGLSEETREVLRRHLLTYHQQSDAFKSSVKVANWERELIGDELADESENNARDGWDRQVEAEIDALTKDNPWLFKSEHAD